MKHSIPKVAASASALLLFLSVLAVWPWGYHVLLRYVVGITAILLVVRAEERKQQFWVFLWITVAILFNPIMPVRLPLAMHQTLSLTCGVLFLVSIRRFRL